MRDNQSFIKFKLKQEIAMLKKKTGTREWAEHNINIANSCSHGCLYCYARQQALRFKQIKNPDEWEKEQLIPALVNKPVPHYDGIVMFPTHHDITPAYLHASMNKIIEILCAGNKLLVVSKPHFECIMRICNAIDDLYTRYKHNLTFRFSIGTTFSNMTDFWEPHAPKPEERIKCLQYAFAHGFKTSVSAEPLLGGQDMARRLMEACGPYITDTIWFGKMNKINERVHAYPSRLVRSYLLLARECSADNVVMRVYRLLKDNPKVRWKDSFQEVIRRELGLAKDAKINP